MKYEKWLHGGLSVLLALCLTLGGLGCMVSGFSLPRAELGQAMVWCALGACTLALFFTLKKGRILVLCIMAVAFGFFTRKIDILQQLEALVYHISSVYNSAYQWGTFRWSTGSLDKVPLTWGLILIGWITCLPAVWVLCRQKSLFWLLIPALLPLASCLVVTDTVPSGGYLGILIFALLLLLLTNRVRRKSRIDGIRLTAMLLVPIFLATLVLFQAVPREKYAVQSDAVSQTILSWIQSLPFVVESPTGTLTISFDGVSNDTVYLSSVGPKSKLRYRVLNVTSEQGGYIYLRDQAYDVYDGTSWTVSGHNAGEDIYWPNQNLTPTDRITVTTLAAKDLYLFPYYPFADMQKRLYENGRMPNSEGQKTYTFTVYSTADPWVSTFQYEQNGVNLLKLPFLRQYINLPDSTRIDSARILSQLELDGLSLSATANAIGKYVYESATYDLNTPRMPETRKDFALWFLQESDTGYCVHFASAATVLLRAAGIPARYVTGYAFSAAPGEDTPVTADRAHAWVEYFDPDIGWTILEPTPPDYTEEDAPVTEAPTDPEPTLAPTQPEPSQPNVPTITPSTPSDAPGLTTPGDSTTPFVLPPWVKSLFVGVCWTAGGCLGLYGQMWLRRKYRRYRMQTGSSNAQGLARWKEVRYMARILRKPLPEDLESLAEKAMFSQHQLSKSELTQFRLWLDGARNDLDQKPWYYRLICRLIWAVE